MILGTMAPLSGKSWIPAGITMLGVSNPEKLTQVNLAAKELISLKKKFETESGSVPEFLCALCGMANMAYKRPDGVYVVPITALGV